MLFTPPVQAEDAVAAYIPQEDPVTRYLDAIERTEAEDNAYSMDLTDLYLGLGKTLVEQGEYDKARKAFQQGVQIVRANFGLHSIDQTSYLFAVADIESRVGDWRSADEIISNIYQIHSRNYGPDNPGMIPVLNQILSWYQGHRPVEAQANSYTDLERSGLIAHKIAEIKDKDESVSHEETAAAYRRAGQIHWHTVKYLAEQGISVEPGVVLAVGAPNQNPGTRNISIKSHISAGREAFTRAAESVAQDENATYLEYAEALAQVGDWNLAFGKKQTAADSYKEAYALLEQNGVPDALADEYFSKPLPVRFLDEELLPVVVEQPLENVVNVTMSMTVTPGGRPLNVTVLEAPEKLPGDQLRMYKRKVSDMRFRPRLVDGVPKKMEDFVWNLPLTEAEASE